MNEKGHRNIAFVGWNAEIENLKHRLLGYESALKNYGVELDENRIKIGALTRESG